MDSNYEPHYHVKAMISIGDEPQLVEIHLDDFETELFEDGISADHSIHGSSLYSAGEGKSGEDEHVMGSGTGMNEVNRDASEPEQAPASHVESLDPVPESRAPTQVNTPQSSDSSREGNTSPHSQPSTISGGSPRVIHAEDTPTTLPPTASNAPDVQTTRQTDGTRRQRMLSHYRTFSGKVRRKFQKFSGLRRRQSIEHTDPV